MPDTNDLLTVKELADYLHKPVQTIYQWNSRGGGPARTRTGRTVQYLWADVLAWLSANREDGNDAA
jgi:excisionase family DNA binding protein